jgi:hypothetical protein
MAAVIVPVLSGTDPDIIVRTENVVARPDSAAKAFVGAGVVSPTCAGSLIAFRRGGKWDVGEAFFLARRKRSLCPA